MLQVLERTLGVRGELLAASQVVALLPEWKALCARSVEDNVYYAPKYARALLDSVEKDKNVRFAVAWDQNSLVGLLPFATTRPPVPLIFPAGKAWQSKYTFSCMPLLDSDRAVETAGALLDVLASVRDGEWIIPTVNSAGQACRAVTEALAERGAPWAFLDPFERATLEPGCSFDEHMQRHLRPKRRRDLARNRRRLEELGKVEHESHGSGEGLERAVAAFLEIEVAGWKGRRGTALACDAATRAFAIRAFTGGEADSICRADMLTLDGAPIAVGLTVFAGSTGFTVKCAYDEAYSSYSAGLLLELEVIRSFLSERWASRLDGATAGAHAIDSLWSGRTEVADLIFSLSPRRPDLSLRAVAAVERMRRSTWSAIRSAFHQLSGQ
ncbi:MAG TPA: GNAT family N-acetyltransferase [Afifellaceae bacterium]|nr:GNAT family N-acetyltransferase [Afifellaceae bacterium]